ncbi:collagen binding domain-containing protein [Paenibacillus sp. GYB006]|uniref:collagen binding domain-containing protein n=1 Tax=Paenibacillus sp. GYB006 TaxID=2994394 RepID=UPI002F96C2AB
MNNFKRMLPLFLVVMVLCNLVFPSVSIHADEKTASSEEKTVVTVTDSVYLEDDSVNTDNSRGLEIKENIITSVKMYNQKPEINESNDLIIKGESIEQVRPNIDDEVAVIFTWEVEYKGKDSIYTFNLPDKFKIGSELSDRLDGDVGQYFVKPNGEVTFIFDEDDASIGQTLEGNFYVWISYDESKMDDGLQQQFDFSSVGQGIINVNFANNAQDAFTKSGEANKNNFNSDEITWTIDFNQSENTIENAVLSDTLPDDLKLKGNIEIRPLVVQLNGSVIAGNVIDTKTEFPINFGDIDQAYRITYTTSVVAPTTAPFTNREYKNETSLTGNDGQYDQSAIGKVTVSFNEPLNKTGQDSEYDPVTQTITWKVKYNYNQQSISQADAWIEDSFDTTKQKLVEDSVKVYQVDIDNSGKPTVNKDPLASSEYTLSGVNSGFDDGLKLQFNHNINTAYVIEYQTQAIDRVYNDTTVTNSVYMYDGTKVETEKGIKEVIFAKSKLSEDFNKKEITWKLVLNRDLKDMTDIVITDDYSDRNMKLKPGSLVVSGIKEGDYQLVANSGDANYEKGFVIQLNKDVTVSNMVEITYTTTFDPTAENKPKDNEYRNTATLAWNESGIAKGPITKSDVVIPQDYTVYNGNKIGEYNAKDKSITWTVDVNYNLFNIQDAIMNDEFTGNQTFVDGSLKVYNLNLNEANNATSVGDELTFAEDQFKLNEDKKGFQLNLGNIGEKAYRIKYKTSLDGATPIVGNYSNHATLRDGKSGPMRFDKSAVVTPKHGGIYVNKTGKQEGSTDIASWTVTINPSQSYIAAGSKLTDTLSENQILLADTLKLYKTELPENNSGQISKKSELVDANDYDLEVNGNTFTFTFNKALNTAFILEYSSYINANDGEKISNKVDFAGQSSSVKGDDNQEGIKVSLAGAGGGASTGKGKIKITKVDDTDQPLAGAIFQIYNATGTTLLETLKPTDEYGETETSRDYRSNNKTNGLPYKLKEVSAPSGYLVDSEYGSETGKIIEFKDPSVPFKVMNQKIRQGFELTKVDSNDFTKKLKGAIFELRLKKGQDTELVEVLTTGEDGRIALGNLVPGDYELIEIQAPEYYKLDATPISFTIVSNQTQIITLTQTNELGTDGKLVVTKVNAKDQSVLKDIEFELRDSTNTVISKKSTDVNGVIEFDSLPYGPYKLVETKADGFVIEIPETQVSITKPETQITIENKENDRSVTLIKYNSSKTLALPGAVFELRALSEIFDQDANYEYQVVTGIEEAKLTTDQNGALYLEDLMPNKYQLVEIKAPAGYVLDNTPVDFEITNKQTETFIVEKTNNKISTPVDPSEPSTGNPNPPVDPNPTPIDPVDPEQPVTPEEPKPEDPDTSVDPEPENPGVSVDPGEQEPGTSIDPIPGQTTDDEGGIVSPDETSKDDGTTGNSTLTGDSGTGGATLPKTGETSHLITRVVGLGLVLYGGTMLLLRRRRIQQHK